MGPLITQQHRDKVLSYVDLGLSEGADLIVDGRGFQLAGHEQGFFMGPCLFDQVKTNMRIYQEEIFGPVLCIVRVPDLQNAIELVNAHPCGNGTAIFTENGKAARQFAEQIQVGMVGINVAIPVPVAHHSFGGWKKSVFADVGMHGDQCVQFYTRQKSITQKW